MAPDPAPGYEAWGPHPTDRLIDILEAYVDIAAYRESYRKFPGRRGQLRQALVRRCLALGLDPFDRFLPHPHPDSLGTEGISPGTVLALDREFFYGLEELPLGIFCTGGTGTGKTTAQHHLIRQANEQGVGAFVPDVRGDARQLACGVRNALAIPDGEDRFNPFEPPEGVPMEKWVPVVVARFTVDLGLQQASQSYLTNLVEGLLEEARKRGTVPTVPDLLDLLKRQKPRPRSSEEGYWERTIARVKAFLMLVGDRVLGVQRGFPLIPAIEQGRLVVLELRVERWIADLLTSFRLYSLYFRRLYCGEPFAQRPVLVVLDEMRSLLRARTTDEMLPDLDLLFSRSRALGISWLVAEHLPSQVSPALLNACHLRIAFNTPPPELAYVARLLGLNSEQARELQKLPVGQAIVRLAGARVSVPFRIQVPAPEART